MRIPYKAAGVILGATVLSTLGISASDTLQGVSSSLVGLALQGGEEALSRCPEHTVALSSRGTMLCVDEFEASPDASCPHEAPRNVSDSETNISNASCAAVSLPERAPWRFISLTQAQQACAKAGKRLPTNEEWYRAALGTPPESDCYTDGSSSQEPRVTDESECRSSIGAYDMIGNVWEWVDESVTEGVYRDRQLPVEGYVSSVDTDGVALTTNVEKGDELYGEDYFWSAGSGVRGIIRGGFYGSRGDAGLYALNASVDLAFASPGIGFRCVTEALF